MSPSSIGAETIRLHRRGGGPPLVLLHCLGVDHRLWEIAAADLDRDFTVMSLDFPGHGAAPLPQRPYGIEDLSQMLVELFDREAIGRAHLGGISLGGLVAQHFAAAHPERVDRLILMDTTPRYTEEMRQMWAVRARQARAEGVASLLGNLLPVWFTPDFVASDPAAVRYVRNCFENDSGEGYALACEALGAADLRALAPRIAAPTLIVCGDQESAAFQDAARWLESNIPNARLAWLSPARHASVLERPEEFTRLARAFLAVSA
ncbi:MAG: alpha/beta fold hydrolase [Alphaproteobacteria bacterium]|nr:alpha/beta fold hydrolase [Alphaproteobacteria bacterium]